MNTTDSTHSRANVKRLMPTHATAVQLFQVVYDEWDEVIEDCVLRGFDITSDPKVRERVVRSQFLWHGYDLSAKNTDPPASPIALPDDPVLIQKQIATQHKSRWTAFRKRKRDSYEEHLDTLEHLEHSIYRQLFDNVNLPIWNPLRDRIKKWLEAVNQFTPPAPPRPSFVSEVDVSLGSYLEASHRAGTKCVREARQEYQGLRATANALLEEILRLDALLLGHPGAQRTGSSALPRQDLPDGSYSKGDDRGLRLLNREFAFPKNRHQSLRIIEAMWPPEHGKKISIADVKKSINSKARYPKWATNEASKIRDLLATIPVFRFSVEADMREKSFWWRALPEDR